MIAEDETGRRQNTRRNKKDMKGIYHPSLDDRVREGGREKKKRPKKEKAKRDCPDFTRCDAEWSGKNAHSFRFYMDMETRKENAGWYPGEGGRDGVRLHSPKVSGSRGICCGSRTSCVWCSRQTRVSVRLVSIIGIVASRVGGAAEGVHVTVVPTMALTALAAHVAA
jgi:hypothetical protein